MGMDFSRTINTVNRNEKNSVSFNIGDKVYGQASVTHGGSGTFAEKAITNIDNIALNPKTLS
jgi:hypothetical protein